MELVESQKRSFMEGSHGLQFPECLETLRFNFFLHTESLRDPKRGLGFSSRNGFALRLEKQAA